MLGNTIGDWSQQELDNWMRQRLNLPGNLQQAIQVAVADATVPVGHVSFTAAASAPDGYLVADGSPVSRSTYAGLHAAIGDTYGAGDGSTTFNLPDLRGRAPYGQGTAGPLAALGGNEGLAVGSRTPVHTHGHPHTHDYAGLAMSTATGTKGYASATASVSNNYDVAENGHKHNVSGTTGAPSAGTTDPSAQPYVALTPIIKT